MKLSIQWFLNPPYVFIGISIVMSLLWGFRGVILHVRDPIFSLPEKDRSPEIYFLRHKHKKASIFFVKTYQFLFNFIGSLFGWGCFYILLLRFDKYFTDLSYFTFGDIFLFIFSLLGLTGHLPQIIYGFVESFSTLTKATLKKVGINSDSE